MAKSIQLNVLGELLQYLRPKNVSDWGPELPNVKFKNFGNIAALNPQPLPPFTNGAEQGVVFNRKPEMHEIADVFLNRMLHQLDALEYKNQADQKQAVQVLARQASLLAGWCGTVPINERLRELLKRLRMRIPPFPDPDPQPDWQSLLITAGLFANAATLVGHEELANVLNKGAESILDAGIKAGGLNQANVLAA